MKVAKEEVIHTSLKIWSKHELLGSKPPTTELFRIL